ncbi:hypothetical protein [Bacillus muralis]|uniref:hypothetical protein n=1 Tax=Peribacillus muralis TaxID=264697 RepID=UPI0007D82B87
MFINEENPLTDEQIVKEFSELVKEHGEVKFNKDDLLLSDRSVINFTYRRFSGRKLYKILDRFDNEMYLEKEGINIKRNVGFLVYSYASGKKQTELNIIKQFIELVKQNKKITLNPSHPSSSPLVANLMQENNLSDIDLGFLLNEYNKLIREDILLIERENIRRYSTL